MGRFGTAWNAFWQILRNPEAAAAWTRLRTGAPLAAPSPPAPTPAVEETPGPTLAADAVYTLVLLQREGRLVDFLLEDIDRYEDAQVGAAVRQIHAGCRRVLVEAFGVVPLREAQEDASVEVPAGFDAASTRLTGRVAGAPPFRGTLRHRGWRAARIRLPERHAKLDPTVICPAEIEI
jgi:hypothetical protein